MQDLSGINTYYMEKEEEAVIRLRVLEDKLRALQGAAGAGAAAAAADGGGGAPARGGGAAAAAELDELRNQVCVCSCVGPGMHHGCVGWC